MTKFNISSNLARCSFKDHLIRRDIIIVVLENIIFINKSDFQREMIKNEISLFNRKVTITKWLSGFSVCDRFIFWFWREGDSELTLRSVDDSSIFGIFLSPCPRLFFFIIA